jgi:outer membrane protein assembly factor BamB
MADPGGTIYYNDGAGSALISARFIVMDINVSASPVRSLKEFAPVSRVSTWASPQTLYSLADNYTPSASAGSDIGKTAHAIFEATKEGDEEPGYKKLWTLYNNGFPHSMQPFGTKRHIMSSNGSTLEIREPESRKSVWEFRLKSDHSFVDGDDIVYARAVGNKIGVLNRSGQVYYLDGESGKRIWDDASDEKADRALTAPLASADGLIALGSCSRDGKRHRVDGIDPQSGEVRWTCELNGMLSKKSLAGMDVSADGSKILVLVESQRRLNLEYAPKAMVVALDARNGKELWSFDMKDGHALSPMRVGSDDTIYAATGTGNVMAIDLNSGTLKWQAEVGKSYHTTTTGDHDTIYVKSQEQSSLIALDSATGHVKWTTKIDGYLDTDIMPDGKGNLLVGTDSRDDSTVWALSAKTGEVKDQKIFPDQHVISSALLPQGELVLRAYDINSRASTLTAYRYEKYDPESLPPEPEKGAVHVEDEWILIDGVKLPKKGERA